MFFFFASFFLEGGWGGVGGLTFFVLEFVLKGRCGGGGYDRGCFGVPRSGIPGQTSRAT